MPYLYFTYVETVSRPSILHVYLIEVWEFSGGNEFGCAQTLLAESQRAQMDRARSN